jgi:hypothetical protein
MSSDIQFTEKVRLDHYNPDEVTNAIRLDEAAHPAFVSETYCPTNFSTYTCNFLVGPIADRLYAYEHLGFTPAELETIIAEHEAYKTMERARTLCGRRMGKTLMMNAERDFQRKLIGKWVMDPEGEPTEIPRVKLEPVDIHMDGLWRVPMPDERGRYAFEKDDLVIFPITSKEKEKETMNKNFTKADLKVGYVVKTRSGTLYMVMPEKDDNLILVREGRHGEPVNNYLPDLMHNLSSRFDCIQTLDIMEVYGRPALKYHALDISTERRPLLWKREEPKEMTLEEVEKALGYPVKIVNK